MKRTKMSAVLALGLIAAMILAGCGGSKPAETTAAPAAETTAAAGGAAETEAAAAESAEAASGAVKEKIVFSTRLDFTTMDINNTPSTISKSVYNAVYNTLVERDVPTNEIVPALAESWEMTSPTDYTFQLREGVKFHDGSDFTAEDVKFTLDRAKEQSGTASKIAFIDSVETDGDYTVKVALTTENMDFLEILTDPSLSIVSKTAFETLGEEEGIQKGTGPYKYKEWNQGSYLDLEANEDYWGGAPATKELRLQYISESNSRLVAVKSGEMDFIQDPPMTELPSIQGDSSLKLITYPSASMEFLFFNTKMAPMDDPKVRKAVELALSRQDIVDGVFLGNAAASGNVMHSSNAYYSDIEVPERNVEEAKKLLAEAGYEKGLELKLISNTNADSQAICTIVQAMLGEAGITVNYEPLENATHSATAASCEGFHIDSCQYSGFGFGPDMPMRALLYTGGGNNYGALSDEKMDQMIDEALTIADPEERKAAYKAIEEYSEELMTVYPICVKNYTFVSGANVEDIPQPNGPIIQLRELVAHEK
ncbi:MAG: ABC transporter substrate-binding protein [Clostridium sp.]|nr:ABC transporter substrate-binding protein [Clostridium sp.]